MYALTALHDVVSSGSIASCRTVRIVEYFLHSAISNAAVAHDARALLKSNARCVA